MSLEDPVFLGKLQRINSLLGGQVIGIETGGDQGEPDEIRLDFAQLERNFTLRDADSVYVIVYKFRRQAEGLRQLLQLEQFAGQDKFRARLELFYTQALLGLASLLSRVMVE